jgi:hypothetical protein
MLGSASRVYGNAQFDAHPPSEAQSPAGSFGETEHDESESSAGCGTDERIDGTVRVALTDDGAASNLTAGAEQLDDDVDDARTVAKPDRAIQNEASRFDEGFGP